MPPELHHGRGLFVRRKTNHRPADGSVAHVHEISVGWAYFAISAIFLQASTNAAPSSPFMAVS